MAEPAVVVALPGLAVLAAGPVTALWILYFRKTGALTGPLPGVAAWFVLAEAVAGGLANGLIHILRSPEQVYWCTVAGFAAAFLLVPPYLMLLSILDTPLASPFKLRGVRLASAVGATMAAAALVLEPSLLIEGVSPRAYAPYGPDLTPLFRTLFILASSLLGYGMVTVAHAVWRAAESPLATLGGGAAALRALQGSEQPPRDGPSQRLRSAVGIIVHGAGDASESKRHLRALFWVFTLRDILMGGFLVAIALWYYGAPSTGVGLILHYWWPSLVDLLTGGLLVWHTFSDNFAGKGRRITAQSRSKLVIGWLAMCLWLPLGWAATQDFPGKWVAAFGFGLAALAVAPFVREWFGGAISEVKENPQERR